MGSQPHSMSYEQALAGIRGGAEKMADEFPKSSELFLLCCDAIEEQIQAAQYEGFSAEHWYGEYIAACKSLTKRVHQGADAVRRERELKEQFEALQRSNELLRSAFAHEKDGQHAKAQRLYDASNPASRAEA